MYCINPACPERQQSGAIRDYCPACGTLLILESKYQVIQRITQTPQTEVFKVNVLDQDEQKILKVLETTDAKQLELFEREYAVLSWLDHPNIPKVDINDYFVVNTPAGRSLHCLVLEKIKGETLEQWVAQNGRTSESIALKWMRQLCAPENLQDLPGVLTYLHSHNLIHRDLKLSNLILQPNGELALIDFGGVRELGQTDAISSNHPTIITSPGYSPPEQVNGQATMTSDFYALGRSWVSLLTGRNPIDLIDSQTNQLRWRHHAPQVSKPFADWLDAMMSASPYQRPQSTTEIYTYLTEKLPQQIRVSRRINSWWFKVSIASISASLVFGIGWGVSLWISNDYLRKGAENLRTEQYQSARTDFEIALKWNDRSAIAHNNLALSCYYLGDDECAIAHYTRAIALSPDYWEAYYNLGSIYDRQERYDLASAQYMKAANGSPETKAQAINNLARLKNRQQQYIEAVSLVQSVIQLTQAEQTLSSLHKNLGWALFRLNRFEEAQTALERALSLDGSRIDTYCLLAFVKQARKLESDAEVKTCLFSATKSPLPEVKEWRIQLAKRGF
ncbi:serine/threonine protein kinase (plasmid) [Leptolyngbya boryana NIES-2135]|uniref:non-specific serine/threonine protein kinase n=1 Tax=Leptolyngbya boryana NIES-2135 TaxID=1973484 RepID=A0A1Z4JTD0_LEPBY|nr:serine/threonine-protein kinase [Leptolyngbya boryana]ULP33711.1 serine/threonine-protein kinase [Leptolyngbya boryana IU 594]BAS60137.1 Protein kinase [Leptolyngbya boryana IAM M-101]BAS66485.1 Protein kinase [Leptolyngbya boryana dg5]BAY59898.1 serine/threonine protein kinase [Leptolyngbya boryana NIES-2135]